MTDTGLTLEKLSQTDNIYKLVELLTILTPWTHILRNCASKAAISLGNKKHKNKNQPRLINISLCSHDVQFSS